MKNLLFVVLVICICFEEIFGKTILHLSMIKYIVAPIILLYIWRCRKKKVHARIPKIIVWFYALLFTYVVLSVPGFFEYGTDGLRLVKQYFWLPILFYIFLYIHRITSYTISDMVNLYVQVMVCYCIMNFFLFFVYLPIWKSWHPYWGRITVGYPTVDVVLLNFAIALLFFYPNKWTHGKVTLYCIILMGALLGLASGTGMALFAMFLVVYIIYGIHTRLVKKTLKYHVEYRAIIISSLFFILLISSVFAYLERKMPELAEGIYMQMENRAYVMLGKEEEAKLKTNTMDARDEEFVSVEEDILNKDYLDNLFGIGFARLTPESGAVKPHIFLESQYHSFRTSIGWVGTICFYLLIISLMIKSIKLKDLRRRYLGVLSLLFLGMSSFTSGTLAIFGIVGVLAILSADYCINLDKNIL